MIFKNWTYRKKNRALLIAALPLFLLCWYLAFGKTFALISQYNSLEGNLAQNETAALDSKLLRDKLARQDSLLTQYAVDSTAWAQGLLSEVGTVLSTQSVGVSFENKSVGVSIQTIERDLLLNGSFPHLQQSLRTLEKVFFIKSVNAYVEKEQLRYRVRLVALKKIEH